MTIYSSFGEHEDNNKANTESSTAADLNIFIIHSNSQFIKAFRQSICTKVAVFQIKIAIFAVYIQLKYR